jgi:hypothetical protein
VVTAGVLGLLLTTAGQAHAYPYNWFNGVVSASDDRIHDWHNVIYSGVTSSGPYSCAGITGSLSGYDGVQCAPYPSLGIALGYPQTFVARPRVKNADSNPRYLHAYWG